jgi:hypothetical protein
MRLHTYHNLKFRSLIPINTILSTVMSRFHFDSTASQFINSEMFYDFKIMVWVARMRPVLTDLF